MRHFLLLLLFLPVSVTAQSLIPTAQLSASNGLPETTINALCTDDEGRLWIATKEGMYSYNGYQVERIDLDHSDVLNVLAENAKIYSVSAINICVTNTLTRETECIEWNEPGIASIAFSKSAIQGINSNGELVAAIDYELNATSSTSPKPQPLVMSGDSISFNKTGIRITGKHQKTITNAEAFAGIEYSRGRFLMGSNDGLHEIKLGPDSSPQTTNHLTDLNITALCKDHLGNVWAGTQGNGIVMIHRNMLLSAFYPLEIKGQPAICHQVFPKGDKLFVATSAGILPLGNHSSYITKETADLHCTTAATKDDVTIIGTEFEGIFRYKDGDVIRMYSDRKETRANSITHIDTTSKGFIASTKFGFVELNRRGYVQNKYTYETKGIAGYVTHFYPTSSGYSATSTVGLYELDFDFNILKKTMAPSGVQLVMSTEQHEVIGSDGNVYQAGASGFTKTRSTEHNLMSIAPGSTSTTWISTEDELMLLGEFTYSYNPANGFPLEEYTEKGQYIHSDGTHYFSGNGGVQQVNPALFPSSAPSPQFRVSYEGEFLQQEDEISLSHTEASVALETDFIAISDQQNLTLRCFLDTLSIPLNADQLLVNLNYGESILSFQLNDGMKTQELSKITLFRASPFYSKWWFKVLTVILAVIMAIGIISLFRLVHARAMLRKTRRKMAMNEMRLDLVRSANSKVGNTLESIRKKSKPLDSNLNEENLTEVHKLTNASKVEIEHLIWAIDEETNSFFSLLDHLEKQFSVHQAITSATFKLSKGNIKDFNLDPLNALNLFKVVNEALLNAARHAEAETITIGIKEEKEIEIAIIDNGKGYNLNSIREGDGIRMMKSKAREIDAEVQMFSSPGSGTEVFVRFKR